MYIVTGGAGFIGSAVVWGLNQRGFDNILIVDHLGSSDKWKNLRALKFCDYMEKDAFRSCLQGKRLDSVEAIIHLGACSSTTEKDASYLVDNNYNYTKELANFAISKEIRFIYASSAATYGDGSNGYSDGTACLRKLRPMNMYGHSKHMFDLYAHENGLFNMIAGLKFFNVFGPNEDHKDDMKSVVQKAYHQILESGEVKLFKSHKAEYGDGEQKRDFIYVKDAVDIILFFLDNYHNGLFNVGTGKAETWNTLIGAVFKAMNKPVNIEYIDMPKHLRDRYQYFTQADMSSVQQLGYKKTMTKIEDAVNDYVVNYLAKEHFLGDETR